MYNVELNSSVQNTTHMNLVTADSWQYFLSASWNWNLSIPFKSPFYFELPASLKETVTVKVSYYPRCLSCPSTHFALSPEGYT